MTVRFVIALRLAMRPTVDTGAIPAFHRGGPVVAPEPPARRSAKRRVVFARRRHDVLIAVLRAVECAVRRINETHGCP